jgi:hypothetical protein
MIDPNEPEWIWYLMAFLFITGIAVGIASLQ